MAHDDRPPPRAARVYQVVVRGRLTDRFAASFDDMAIQPGDHESVIIGPVRDQSHLMGILATVQALGLELLSACPTGASSATSNAQPPAARSAQRPPM